MTPPATLEERATTAATLDPKVATVFGRLELTDLPFAADRSNLASRQWCRIAGPTWCRRP